MNLRRFFRSKSITLLFFFSAFLVLFIPIKTPLNMYDEGFAVFNATRLLRGDLPYKDFWAIYPPGQFYVLAFVFKAFGATLLAARVYDTLVRFALVIAIYLTARKITSAFWALLACLTTVLLLATDGAYGYAVFPALALGLFGVLSLLKSLETARSHWLFLSGALVGAASLFRWDIALYAGASLCVALFLSGAQNLGLGGERSLEAFWGTSKKALILFAGVLAVALPCYGILGLMSGFGNLWRQVVVFPVTELPALRWKPYPPLFPFVGELTQLFTYPGDFATFKSAYAEFLYWLRFYLPLFAYGIGLSSYAYSLLRKRMILDKRHLGQIAILILGLLLFSQALSRYDSIHVLPTSIIAFLVIFLIAEAVFKIQGRILFKSTALVLLTLFLTAYFYSPVERLSYFASAYSPFECHSDVERAGCVSLSSDQEGALEYINAHAQEGEPIFVGNQRHDLISVMDISFYFLSEHPSATFYHELYPGVATTRAVQKAIASEIKAKGVNWIVLVNTGRSYDPNASSVSSGVHYLDDNIRSRYVRVAEFGIYEIWGRVTK